MITLDEIMTTKPHTLFHDQSILDARNLMMENNIRHVPILDRESRLVGLFTQRDLFAVMESSTSEISIEERCQRESEQQLYKVMTRNPTCTTRNAPIRDVALFLQNEKFGCVPVLEAEKLVGVVTDSDLVSVAINLLEQLEQTEPLVEGEAYN